MDNAVALVRTYLHVNGYFTVMEYPVIESLNGGTYRCATDLDVLAFRFPGAGMIALRHHRPVHRDHRFGFVDPQLGVRGNQANMVIGEIKEGRAELNTSARNPVVLRTALARFGGCSPEHIPPVVEQLLRYGEASTHCQHAVRPFCFGSEPPAERSHFRVILPGHVVDFLSGYIRKHWAILLSAQSKDPGPGFPMMPEKAQRRPGTAGK